MENIITYVKTDLKPFSEEPFHETDSLVLAWLSYLRFEEYVPAASEGGCLLKELYMAEYFPKFLRENPIPEDSLELLNAVCASPRFRDIRVMTASASFEDDVNTVQFAAMTFRVADDLLYVAFRGTDTTFAGWREDFELALTEAIPAQQLAERYLTAAALRHRGSIIVGGHSKGGNLAVYAAANCPEKVQKRIGLVYSFDGPGFLRSELEKEGFRNIRGRISKVVPKGSLFGLLFSQECEYRVVQSTAHGVDQHSPFTWVLSEGTLVGCGRVNMNAELVANKINNWIESLTQKDRRRFIDSVFGLVARTGAKTLDEFEAALPKNISSVLAAAAGLERDMQLFLLDTLRLFLTAGWDDGEKQPFRFPWEEEKDKKGPPDFR